MVKNKVAESRLITIDLNDWYPKTPIENFDISSVLSDNGVLREKEFRATLNEKDWSLFIDKIVLLKNTDDYILPGWAFLLCGKHIKQVAKNIFLGTLSEFLITHYKKVLLEINLEKYKNKSIIIKGCSSREIPNSVQIMLLEMLMPIAKSIMYGEACSAVPIFKTKKS